MCLFLGRFFVFFVFLSCFRKDLGFLYRSGDLEIQEVRVQEAWSFGVEGFTRFQGFMERRSSSGPQVGLVPRVQSSGQRNI